MPESRKLPVPENRQGSGLDFITHSRGFRRGLCDLIADRLYYFCPHYRTKNNNILILLKNDLQNSFTVKRLCKPFCV